MCARRLVTLIAGVLLACSSARAARAAEPRKLVYVAPRELRCPDEASLRRQVAARVGYDAFAAGKGEEVLVRIRAGRAGGVEGHVEMRAVGGGAPAVRDLTSTDCEELVSALAVTVAVGIDPMSLVSAPAEVLTPETTTPIAEAQAPAPKDEKEAAVAAERGARLRVYAGPAMTVGATPTVTAGVRVGAGARWPGWSIGGEGRVDLPIGDARVETAGGGGAIEASVIAGAVVPCVHRGVLRGCVVGTAGVTRGAASGVAFANRASLVWAAAGARLGVEVPIGGAFAIGAHVDALAALTRTTLRLDEVDVWTSPPLSAAGGLDLAGTF